MKKTSTGVGARRVVDRASLIALTEGILLSRDSDGHVIIGDRQECYDAIDALNRGETVLLTVSGRIVSQVKKTKRGYVESAAPLLNADR